MFGSLLSFAEESQFEKSSRFCRCGISRGRIKRRMNIFKGKREEDVERRRKEFQQEHKKKKKMKQSMYNKHTQQESVNIRERK